MDKTYDYVIVGAGSAGCVLANRLTADPANQVLLLEAGPSDWHPMIHIPLGYAYNLARPTVNWMYETEPEAGAGGRRFPWPRGKTLGGSSAINGMIYVRGQSLDFDHWRQLGNEGWSWDNVLPYFRRSESYQDGKSETRGGDGPLHVEEIEEHELSDALLRALMQSGLPRRDINSGNQEGCGYVQSVTKNGRRQSTAVAYLKSAKKRPNLTIATNALAEKILFEGRRAIGVQYRLKDKVHKALAGREVIVSGGTVNSPQLLEISGIGNAELLRSHGVEVIQDSSHVGENLQDHYTTFCSYRVTKPITINELTRGLPLVSETLKYLVSRKGLFTLTPAHVLAFMRTRPELETPDIQIHALPATLDPDTNALEREPGMTCAPCQLRPESRGSIHILSKDPRKYPEIRANYLSAEMDQRTVVAALKLCRDIVKNSALDPYRGPEIAPGVNMQSDDELLAFSREQGTTLYHPTSTCRMGSDPKAVVDARLWVHGVSGLRVIDASVMPSLVSGNTNAATIMIAEKGSDMILEDRVA